MINEDEVVRGECLFVSLFNNYNDTDGMFVFLIRKYLKLTDKPVALLVVRFAPMTKYVYSGKLVNDLSE